MGRTSFVGRSRDVRSGKMSKPRLFGGEIGSIGMSRSIGDRRAARACVSTPDIRTVSVGSGALVRIIISSDGVWDVVSNEQAERIALGGAAAAHHQHANAAAAAGHSRATSTADSALRLVRRAHSERYQQSVAPDDITAIVVDVHGGPLALSAGARACCGTSRQLCSWLTLFLVTPPPSLSAQRLSLCASCPWLAPVSAGEEDDEPAAVCGCFGGGGAGRASGRRNRRISAPV